ncbi:MAG: glycosyltransferase, partial [bacterium]
YIASMDVTVAPYPPMNNFYFSPIKIFEYAAMAKPIVTSAQGQPSDVVQDRKTGLLYAPGDRKDLINCLILLSDNKELRLQLGQRAREMVLKRHSWDGKAKRVAEIASMLSRRQPPQLYKTLSHPAPPISSE